MSLSTLKVNSLYVVLFIRADPPLPDDFHWAFYFHCSETGGTKYHIKNLGSGWMPDHAPNTGIFKEFLLVGLFKVANIPVKMESLMDEAMRTYDFQLIETEIKTWGNLNATSSSQNVQPRPVGSSLLCIEIRPMKPHSYDLMTTK
ncbi:hypothetical protein N7495_001167 [Penicillium taxi]|uniref:uncharacterized protein n=1 Tax=Penicillium taxi TaxID=168475 RepID=UPI00254519B6|nr:uncharacterized protein N7495_001167 [Penicillium taxi]KAJ5908485.1 hypothetical protein N7495_001167 [Penicillium taxi]